MLATLLLAAIPLVAPGPSATPSAPPPPPTGCNGVPLSTQIADPPELRSYNGVLALTLYLRGNPNPNILEGLCWWYSAGNQATSQQQWIPPTLRLHQGDTLQLTLVNELVRPGAGVEPLAISNAQSDGMQGMRGMSRGEDYTLMCGQPQLTPTPTPDPQTGRIFGYHRSPWNETNMHFHGLNVSPLQPSDDVVGVLLCPAKTTGEKPKSYTYVVNIPHDEPPGTYWYHPHPHGESDRQLISQLTGAIIIDQLEPSIVDQLKNRLIIVRDVGELGTAGTADQSPAASKIRAMAPSMAAIRASYRAHGPPAMNFGPPPFRFGPPQSCPQLRTGMQTNAKVLRINLLPLPVKPDTLKGLPNTSLALGATEYWRFANTSADTILDVEQLVNGKRVPLAITSRDGVPLVVVNGRPTWQPVPMNLVRLSPGSRMEFYVHGSAPGTIVLRTRTVDTGCLGDVTLARDLLVVYVGGSSERKPLQQSRLAAPRAVNPIPIRFSDLATQIPKHHRYFVLTEYNRSDEIFPDFYVTELSNPNAIEHPFAMKGPPDVVVKSGTVEDWTILNYTQEIHEFHMHQIHFLVLKGDGIGHGAGQLLDTVDVPYGSFASGSSGTFTPGAVTLRMDFRDPSIIGEFVYHCHILAHEDAGMMARIRVER